MNSACSTCFESFTSISEISATPCGHVFHTSCIEKWLKNGQKPCPQCREKCRIGQVIKLYFSEAESEETIFQELWEANRKLQKEKLKLQKENSKISEVKLEFQNENSKLEEEKLEIQNENSKLEEEKLEIQNENSQLKEENLRMQRQIRDLKSNSSKIERNLRIESEKANKFELEVNRLKTEKLISFENDNEIQLRRENLRLQSQIKDLKSNSSKIERNLKIESEKANKFELEVNRLQSEKSRSYESDKEFIENIKENDENKLFYSEKSISYENDIEFLENIEKDYEKNLRVIDYDFITSEDEHNENPRKKAMHKGSRSENRMESGGPTPPNKKSKKSLDDPNPSINNEFYWDFWSGNNRAKSKAKIAEVKRNNLEKLAGLTFNCKKCTMVFTDYVKYKRHLSGEDKNCEDFIRAKEKYLTSSSVRD